MKRNQKNQQRYELFQLNYKKDMELYNLNNHRCIDLYKFNHDLFQKLCEVSKEHENIFFSPLSISTALSMLLIGSDGYTKQQIEKSLGFVKNKSLLQDLKNLNSMLNFATGETIKCIKLANSLFSDKSIKLLKNYLEEMRSTYNCEVIGLDFMNSAEESKDVINKWVETNTNEKIKDLFKSINPETACILVSCIYFEGDWVNKFKRHKTVEGNFYCLNNSVSVVKMMCAKGSFSWKQDTERKFQCVKLSYKPHNRMLPADFYMLVILPDEKFGLDEVAKSLDAKTIKSLTDNDSFRNRGLDLKIPKFKLSYEINLNETLKLLGITDAFDENSANFNEMTKDQIFVSEAVHKAFIEVNEEGTVAAAATGIRTKLLRCRNYEDHPFIVDHPFMVLIQHKQQTLFMGKINSL